MKPLTLILLSALAAPALALDFDANGKRLDPEPERQREYQWKDPRTGQTVTKHYPPANIQMRQIGRSPDGWMTYLEVIQIVPGESNLSAAVSGGTLSSNAQGGLRDSESWLASEPERKAAEEAQRRAEASAREAQAKADAAQQAVDRAQQDFDNKMKVLTIKAMLDPKVIILSR